MIEWRRVAGAFQFNLVISTKDKLLHSEERLLAWLRWMELKMPKTRSWYPVLLRYIDQIVGRVQGFGGDPEKFRPRRPEPWAIRILVGSAALMAVMVATTAITRNGSGSRARSRR